MKAAVFARKTASDSSRLRQLLNIREMGDQRPSQLLHRMQQGLGSITAEADASLLCELFLRRLPSSMVVVLAAAVDMPLDQLANLADRVAENSAPTTATSSRCSEQQACPLPLTVTNTTKTRLSRLEQAVQDLWLCVHRHNVFRWRPRSCRSSPVLVFLNTSHCWYHQTFEPDARK